MQFLAQNFPHKIALSCEDQDVSFAELTVEIQKMSLRLKNYPRNTCFAGKESSSICHSIISLSKYWQTRCPDFSSGIRSAKRTTLSTNMTINEAGELLELQENNQNQHHPELALVLFTSGSTGQTKAVQLSLNNIIANCHAVIKALNFIR